jgi:hypothetical protein
MREIKFRGKTVDNGIWVYGTGITDFLNIYKGAKPNSKWLWSNYYQWIEVIPESVGQFIGQQDVNRVDIYEGDIVIHTSFINDKQTVVFKKGGFFVQDMLLSSYHPSNIEVVGNIYQNPKLLEEK